MRLIDADALLENIQKTAVIDHPFVIGVRCGIIYAEAEIKEAPAIDPVRHGRWIPNYGGHNIARCSACQKEQHVQEAFLKFWTYCPSCGAKMDGLANAGGENK